MTGSVPLPEFALDVALEDALDDLPDAPAEPDDGAAAGGVASWEDEDEGKADCAKAEVAKGTAKASASAVASGVLLYIVIPSEGTRPRTQNEANRG